MQFSITLLYASVLALILVGLSWQVVRLRGRHHVGVGTGGVGELERAVRAQANFCEYVPLALLMLLLLEAVGALPAVVLHVLGLMLVIGRIAHGFFGLNRSAATTRGRFVGTFLTWLMLVACGLLGLGYAIGWRLL